MLNPQCHASAFKIILTSNKATVENLKTVYF